MSATGASGSPDADALRTEIEKTRADLAATADALAAKLDVKARAGHRVDEAKQSVSGLAAKAKESVPPPVQHALDRAGSAVAPAAARAKPYRREIGLGLLGAAVLTLVIRRRRSA